MGTWARLVGYAVGVLGAACLWVLLAGSPAAAADDAPAPRERGLLGAATDSVSDTVRTTVDRAAGPVRDATPAPVRRVVDATTDAATASVDRVGATVASTVDRPVAQVTEQVRDPLSTAADQVATPDAPDPTPAPETATAPRSQELDQRLPGRDDARQHIRRPAADAPPGTVDRPGAATVMRIVDLVPQVAHDEPGTSSHWIGEAEPDGSATTPVSSGAGPVADAVDRVVLPVPRGVALVVAALDRAVPFPASSPGFSPD